MHITLCMGRGVSEKNRWQKLDQFPGENLLHTEGIFVIGKKGVCSS